MNAKNLMLRASLAASVAGSLGLAGLSPASATLITLSGPGSDFGGGTPYSESDLTFTSNTAGFVGPLGSPSAVTVTPTPYGGVHAFDVTSEQSSMFDSEDAAQNVTLIGTMGNAAPVTNYSTEVSMLNLTGFEHPVSLLQGSRTFDNLNLAATAALAKPHAGAIMLMLMGFAGVGLAARRLLRKAPALFGA